MPGPDFAKADRYYPVFCFYVAALYRTRRVDEAAKAALFLYEKVQGVQWELRRAVARKDLDWMPAHLSAILPPRVKPGEGPMDSPFRVDYLDAERLLPVLVRKAT